jgi:soluble lytic murein transglycosylase
VRRALALLTVLAACAAGVAAASGERTRPAPAVIRAAPASFAPRAPAARACPVPARWRPAFRAAAEDARLPASLLAAVAYVESRFVESARSPRGAVGLLQVMPQTGAVLALDVYEPATNVLAGARFLRELVDRFGSTDLALAAYNAGPVAVERAGGAPSGETLRYVFDVNARWRAHVGCAL